MIVKRRYSRAGCMECKRRKIKCDEVHPTCGNCQRVKFPCVYPAANKAKKVRSSREAKKKQPTNGSGTYKGRRHGQRPSTPSSRRTFQPGTSAGIQWDAHTISFSLELCNLTVRQCQSERTIQLKWYGSSHHPQPVQLFRNVRAFARRVFWGAANGPAFIPKSSSGLATHGPTKSGRS